MVSGEQCWEVAQCYIIADVESVTLHRLHSKVMEVTNGLTFPTRTTVAFREMYLGKQRRSQRPRSAVPPASQSKEGERAGAERGSVRSMLRAARDFNECMQVHQHQHQQHTHTSSINVLSDQRCLERLERCQWLVVDQPDRDVWKERSCIWQRLDQLVLRSIHLSRAKRKEIKVKEANGAGKQEGGRQDIYMVMK